MSEDKDEISSLKQTLRAQQKLVHELYLELEAEREASCIAANEALSMILRLQREKAADKLEAIQFKRMTQEDLNHAHQIILLFQETLRHKDMFIASLDYQLQAYRHQMLAMGFTDSQIRDLELAPQNNGDLPCAGASASTDSTPDNPQACDHEFKDLNTICEESAPNHLRSSYWEQIEHLDTRVRRGLSSPAQVINEEFDPLSSSPAFHDVTHPCSSYQASDPDHTSFPCSERQNTATVHDVFEVPLSGPAFQEDNRLRNPDPFPHGSGTTNYICRDETEGSKSSASDEIKRNKPGGVGVDCHLALMDLANGIFPFQNDLHRLKKRLDKLEGGRGGKPGGASGNEEEELNLLREIHEKLSTIQCKMKSGRSNHPVVDESSLISLMENLFFYSL